MITPLEVGAVNGIPDLCPIVPISCVVPDIPVNPINPIGSFFDSWFGFSPQESLKSVVQMVFSVNQVPFDSDWFKTMYVDSGITWIGWSLSTIFLICYIAFYGWRVPGSVAFAFKRWIFDLLLVAFLPILIGVNQMFAYALMKLFKAISGVDNADGIVGMVPTQYWDIGVMSFVVRGVAMILMFYLVFLNIRMILTVFFSGMFVTMRNFGSFGDEFMGTVVRYILVGVYAQSLMIFILCFVFGLLSVMKLFLIGSLEFMTFGAILGGMGLCIYIPMKVSKGSKDTINKAVITMSERFEQSESTTTSSVGSTASDRVEQVRDRRELRKQRRTETVGKFKERAVTAVGIGAAFFTGGASAAAAFGVSQSGGKPGFMKVQAGVDEARKYIAQRDEKRKQRSPREEES